MTRIKGFNLVEEKIPFGSGDLVTAWLDKDPVQIFISKPRRSKLGDFRPAHNGRASRISVNSDLHPVEFLITLAHEIAHAENFRVNGHRVKPHGLEWKKSFRNKLSEVIRAGFLDEKFYDAIIECYFKKERLATSFCPSLRRMFDEEDGAVPATRVQDIPIGSIFKTRSGRLLQKGKRIRTRYKCKDIKTRRYYTVHPMAEIEEFEPPEL